MTVSNNDDDDDDHYQCHQHYYQNIERKIYLLGRQQFSISSQLISSLLFGTFYFHFVNIQQLMLQNVGLPKHSVNNCKGQRNPQKMALHITCTSTLAAQDRAHSQSKLSTVLMTTDKYSYVSSLNCHRTHWAQFLEHLEYL